MLLPAKFTRQNPPFRVRIPATPAFTTHKLGTGLETKYGETPILARCDSTATRQRVSGKQRAGTCALRITQNALVSEMIHHLPSLARNADVSPTGSPESLLSPTPFPMLARWWGIGKAGKVAQFGEQGTHSPPPPPPPRSSPVRRTSGSTGVAPRSSPVRAHALASTGSSLTRGTGPGPNMRMPMKKSVSLGAILAHAESDAPIWCGACALYESWFLLLCAHYRSAARTTSRPLLRMAIRVRRCAAKHYKCTAKVTITKPKVYLAVDPSHNELG
ncbi:hypothetical protein B0H13DRAFT_1911084 [Mycena leptocephala]|nr:hypothetical protein B0H13DRAFT_1911084 [Mycena leptocephala]